MKVDNTVMRLTKRRLDKLSDIASDIGLISLASVVLPAALDRFNPYALAWGLVATIVFWLISLILRR